MELLLGIAITLLALCVIILQSRNNSLHHTVHAWKSSFSTATNEAREWERKYWAEHTNSDTSTMSPPSHGVEDVDVEALMADSDDPVWDIVVDCRSVGVMGEWLNQHPEIAAQQPHRRYSEFATFILQLPEHQRSVHGVTLAVRGSV
jgi:hypothetical protein